MKDLYEQLTRLVIETSNCTFTIYFRKRDKKHIVRIKSLVFKADKPELALQQAISFLEDNRTNVGLTGYRLD